jgi:hypothetical protein
MATKSTRESRTATLLRLESENVMGNLSCQPTVRSRLALTQPILAAESGEVTHSCLDSGGAVDVLERKDPTSRTVVFSPLAEIFKPPLNSGM